MHGQWRPTLIITALMLTLVSFIPPTYAAPTELPGTQSSDDALIAQLRQATNNTVRIARHTETGKVRFIGTVPQQPVGRSAILPPTATAEQSARAFLNTYGPLFGVRDQAQELTAIRDVTVQRRQFVRFQQRIQDIPVLAGELILQVDQSRNVVSASGEALPDVQQRPIVSVDAAAATKQALAVVAREYNLSEADLRASEPQLWWFNPSLLGGPGVRRTTLNWRMDVTSGGATPVRELVLVDTERGVVTLHFNQMAHGKERHVCDDKNNVDPDGDETNNCPPSRYVRDEGEGPTGIADIDLAYDYSGATYDYYATNFKRDSLDDKGLPLISLVRYCPDPSVCPYDNAFWDGQQMTYGAGFASADDVVGHELTHGFTDFSSHLFYYYQSGAINESMSDVFGELIDLSDESGNDSPEVRWLMGEDLPSSIGVIRNMKDPTSLPPGVNGPYFEPSPDRTGSPLYRSEPDDSGGVHLNSGVNNKALSLMVDGGTFNGYTISGIGAFKAGWIYYVTNNALLVSGSDYQDLYDMLQTACTSLVGTVTTAADCAEVTKVVNATEMDRPPATLKVADAPVCTPGQTVTNAFFDDLEHPSSGNWTKTTLVGSTNGWYYPPNDNPFDIDSEYATSGTMNFWGDDPGDVADYAIGMTHDVAVPPNGFFHFNHAYSFDGSSFARFDGGVVEYSTNGGKNWQDVGPLFEVNGYNSVLSSQYGNPLGGRRAFGGVSKGYYSSRADLNSLAGQKVRFRFRIGSDNTFAEMGWFIDDVRIATCSGVGSSPPLLTGMGDITVTQAGSAVKVNLAKVEDGQESSNSFPVSVSNVPAGMTITVKNEFGVISAEVAAGCTTVPGSYDLSLTATDSSGLSDTIGFRVTVLSADKLIADESFEAGTPNKFWRSDSTTYGSVICNETSCGSNPTIAKPHTGEWWAWFGSSPYIEDGYVEQTVDIPAGGASLDFALWIGNHSGNGTTDYIRVLINGNEIFRATDADKAYDGGYQPVSLDVSAYAGDQRVLRIEEHNRQSDSFFVVNVDDVTLTPKTTTCSQQQQQPMLKFDTSALQVPKRVGTVTLNVSLSSPSAQPVEADYATSGGTAAAGVDYTAINGTVTFAPGETSQTITLPLLGNSSANSSRTVVISLSNARNAAVSTTASSVTLTILSDEYLVYLPTVLK